MKLWIFIVRRIILLIPVLIGVMTITFVLLHSLPLDEQLEACSPVNPHHPESDAQREAQCGLNAPIFLQYGVYIGNIFTFHWGYVDPGSCLGGQFTSVSGCLGPDGAGITTVINNCFQVGGGSCPTTNLISSMLPYTLELAFLSLLLILIFSIPLGTYSAVKRNRPLDQATRVFSFSGYALPGFLLGSLVFIGLFFAFNGSVLDCGGQASLFSVWGSWPPTGSSYGCLNAIGNTIPFLNSNGSTSPTGVPILDAVIYAATHAGPSSAPNIYWWIAGDSFLRILFPALVIAFGSIAGILRFVRNSTLEVMNLDYVRTARAKGLPEGVVVSKHAGRTSLNATITVLGLTFAFFMGGFAVIETVFQLLGVGRIFTYSLTPPIDAGVLTASTLFLTILVVIANIIVDVLYAYLDPRVRLG